MDIDLSNAPEGATHYFRYSELFYKLKGSEWLYYSESSRQWSPSANKRDWHEENLTPIPWVWTIYNNTKPLSELTDEQAAELFNYWRNGGEVEYLYTSEDIWVNASATIINANIIYRAKQKSERELFAEAAAKVMFEADGIDHLTLGALFDAGFKAPKGGE